MEEAGCPAEAIALARSGYYDDFKSPEGTPIILLVNDLRANGFPELAERAIAGEFDSTPEESAAWFEGLGRQLLTDEGAPPTARSALLDHIWRSHGGV